MSGKNTEKTKEMKKNEDTTATESRIGKATSQVQESENEERTTR